MTAARPRKATPKKKPPAVDRGKRGPFVTVVHTRVARPRRVRRSREVLGLRCRVVGVHPDAETLVLRDFYGQQVLVPVTSAQRDGRLTRDLVGLIDKDVWLSLRLP